MDVVANTRQTFIPDRQHSLLATLDSSTGVLTKRGELPMRVPRQRANGWRIERGWDGRGVTLTASSA